MSRSVNVSAELLDGLLQADGDLYHCSGCSPQCPAVGIVEN